MQFHVDFYFLSISCGYALIIIFRFSLCQRLNPLFYFQNCLPVCFLFYSHLDLLKFYLLYCYVLVYFKEPVFVLLIRFIAFYLFLHLY